MISQALAFPLLVLQRFQGKFIILKRVFEIYNGCPKNLRWCPFTLKALEPDFFRLPSLSNQDHLSFESESQGFYHTWEAT